MTGKLTLFVFLFFAIQAAWPCESEAGTVGITDSSGSVFNLHVVSLKEARFKTVIKQQYDFSCGSAALATTTKQMNRPYLKKCTRSATKRKSGSSGFPYSI